MGFPFLQRIFDMLFKITEKQYIFHVSTTFTSKCGYGFGTELIHAYPGRYKNICYPITVEHTHNEVWIINERATV